MPIKFSELLPGKYTVYGYQDTKSTYIVKATHENGDDVIFWSTNFLTDYINKKHPNSKFEIKKEGDRFFIEGFRAMKLLQ